MTDLPGESVVAVITPTGIAHVGPVQACGHTHTKELPLLKQAPPFIHGFGAHTDTPNQE
jgi:hypothetical protein